MQLVRCIGSEPAKSSGPDLLPGFLTQVCNVSFHVHKLLMRTIADPFAALWQSGAVGSRPSRIIWSGEEPACTCCGQEHSPDAASAFLKVCNL